MTSQPVQPTQGAEQVLRAALELALDIGVSGVGARPLVALKGLHRSAVNYHFGSRRKLLALVYTELLKRRRSMLHLAIERIEYQPAHLLSMPSFFSATHGEQIVEHRGADAFFIELLSQPDLFCSSMEDRRMEDIQLRLTLWRAAASRLGCPEEAVCWFLLSEGLPEFGLLSQGGAGASPWLPELSYRFADRLAGRQPLRTRRYKSDDHAWIEETPYSDAKCAIVEATTSLLTSRKSITLRAIAERSGIALSTVKYLFPNKEEIVSGAYRMIHRGVLEDAEVDRQGAGPLAMGRHFDDAGGLCGPLHAIISVTSLVSRTAKLASLGSEMQRLRGSLAEISLIARGVAGADRLDGLIWSLLSVGTMGEALAQPAALRQAWVKKRSEELSLTVFGIKPAESVRH